MTPRRAARSRPGLPGTAPAMALLAVMAVAVGCAGPRPVPAPRAVWSPPAAHLVLSPGPAGFSAGPEAYRNDGTLGRFRPGYDDSVAIHYGRERLRVNNGRPYEHSTYGTWTAQRRRR